MQNQLKAVLAGSFILLIMLLMLQMCKHDSSDDAVERAEEIGGTGDIKVTLMWDFMGDVDLHVEQPAGDELYYLNMRTGGGVLDVDNRTGGTGSAENAYWRNPAHGRYKIRVVMYAMSAECPTGGTVKVVIKVNDNREQYTVPLTYQGEDVTVAEINYPA